jgi:hypothetical protein
MSRRGRGHAGAYFRKRFDVQDPALLRDLTLRLRVDDGAVVYLNGREVHRSNFDKRVLKPVTARRSSRSSRCACRRRCCAQAPTCSPCELHQYEDNAQDDLVFDADARRRIARTPPSRRAVRIALDDALVHAGQAMQLKVDAVDPNGEVRKVTLFVDDKPVQAEAGASTFAWTPAIGPQRLRVVAEDSDGLATTEDRLVVWASTTCRRW